jgi:hypothetical protein
VCGGEVSRAPQELEGPPTCRVTSRQVNSVTEEIEAIPVI